MNIAVIPFTQWLVGIIEYAAFVGFGAWLYWTFPRRTDKKLVEGQISKEEALREKKKFRLLGASMIGCFLLLLVMALFNHHT